jgi:hypothetical protein
MNWEPVLDGHLADEVRAAVHAIADRIADVELAHRSPVDAALFWAYAAGAFDDEASLSRYDAATTRLAEHVEQGFPATWLYGGLAGAGWVLAHIGDDESEFLDGVDQMLLDALEESPWRGDYDLIRGLVGQGVYFLERLRGGGTASARRGIERVVAQLAATAERTADGVTWHTAPELLVAWQREQWPAGYYNLGMAHGVPGAAAMLGAVAALPEPELAVTAARARELCEGATRWVRAQRLPADPPDPRGHFPAMIDRELRAPGAARTAWCYGDPGIAAALWSTALRTGGDPEEWHALALAAARRPAELCHVSDPNLCHGAAGLAHLWNRFYQASGDHGFRDAARSWFERTLAMRRPGEGIAGFTARRPRVPGVDDTLVDRAVPDFLDGTVGVALALLAGLGGDEPGWDRLLLCDLPPLRP